MAKEFIDVKFAYSEEKLTNFLLTLVSACILKTALSLATSSRMQRGKLVTEK